MEHRLSQVIPPHYAQQLRFLNVEITTPQWLRDPPGPSILCIADVRAVCHCVLLTMFIFVVNVISLTRGRSCLYNKLVVPAARLTFVAIPSNVAGKFYRLIPPCVADPFVR